MSSKLTRIFSNQLNLMDRDVCEGILVFLDPRKVLPLQRNRLDRQMQHQIISKDTLSYIFSYFT